MCFPFPLPPFLPIDPPVFPLDPIRHSDMPHMSCRELMSIYAVQNLGDTCSHVLRRNSHQICRSRTDLITGGGTPWEWETSEKTHPSYRCDHSDRTVKCHNWSPESLGRPSHDHCTPSRHQCTTSPPSLVLIASVTTAWGLSWHSLIHTEGPIVCQTVSSTFPL